MVCLIIVMPVRLHSDRSHSVSVTDTVLSVSLALRVRVATVRESVTDTV